MQLQFLTGSYLTRGLIAGAQRCVNLYPEVNNRENFLMIPQSASPTLLTHYPTPGLTLLGSVGDTEWRGLYRANNGSLYGVCGSSVYLISSSWTFTKLGSIGTTSGQVSMADNGITAVLVDGSINGYTINLSTNAFASLVDPTGLFVGADKVDYIDTFFVFNKPGTQAFYSSLSNSTTFDPLYIANKTAHADKLVTLCVNQRQIWLLGERTTEIWYDSGANAFPFEIVPGAFIEHGCAAKYSVAQNDTSIFWLSEDDQGLAIVFQGTNYVANRISPHVIELEFQSYSTISDAIGYIHQQGGHIFYVLTFPTANKTWVYDIATNLWHERMYLDSNGNENRHRSNCGAFAYGSYVVGDWQNGNLYAYDVNNYTDNGSAIKRIRGFPHVINELKRVMYRQFIADMQVAAVSDLTISPNVELRWSDDRGATFGTPLIQTMGNVGETSTVIQFQRLGMARDRVFELSWSANVSTALNGAFISITPAAS